MRTLAAPGLTAVLALLVAALVHPALHGLMARLPGIPIALVAAALLLALSLVARAPQGASDSLTAMGAVAVVAALGYDALRGHAGTLTLAPGQGARIFEEAGPGGRKLGFRPLGFDVVLEDLGEKGEATLAAVTRDGRSVRVVAGELAVSLGGFRVGAPRRVATGDAARLRLAVSTGGRTQQVDLVPGAAARLDDIAIGLEKYFPDFALDERNQPFSRSAEPRNPAALLQVVRGVRSWRVFVIQAMPGIHQQEGLGATLSLVSVEPVVSVTLAVAREPAAPLAGAGLVVAALGLALGWPRR